MKVIQAVKDLVKIKNGRIEIEIPEDLLFQYPDLEIPKWEPENKIKEYSEVPRYSIDIETTGLDKYKDEIRYIGVYRIYPDSEYFIFYNRNYSEIDVLFQFTRWMDNEMNKWRGEDVIFGFHNGFNFDLPFLIQRYIHCGIQNQSPFEWNAYTDYDSGYVKVKHVRFATAQRNSQAQEYDDVRVSKIISNYKKIAIIDTYHQLLAWDFVFRKIQSFSLKNAPYELGLITDPRTELSYGELLQCYEQKNHSRLIDYLKDDLYATGKLIDFLMPSIWYQKLILNKSWKLQTIATAGNATKWNSILKDYYENKAVAEGKRYAEPKPQARLSFTGGLTSAQRSGLFFDVSKVDVASMYPNIMIIFGVFSAKDSDAQMLAIVDWARQQKTELKRQAKKTEDPIQKQNLLNRVNATKVIINSAYGSLAAQGTAYNDYQAGAIVTAYGRSLLRYMERLIIENKGITLELDTDGLIYTSESLEKNKEIHQIVQSRLPKGFEIEYEFEAQAIFIPSDKKDSHSGQRKNYMIFMPGGKIKKAGQFRKRDQPRYFHEFQADLITEIIPHRNNKEKMIEVANQFLAKAMIKLATREYDPDYFRITKKVAANHKNLLNSGLCYDQDGVTMIQYYYKDKDALPRSRSKKLQVEITNTELYSVAYYSQIFKNLWYDVMRNFLGETSCQNTETL